MKNQAERVCQLLENALHIYTNLYETDDKFYNYTDDFLLWYIFPLYNLPDWLQIVVGILPLTLANNLLRTEVFSMYSLLDMIYLIIITLILLVISRYQLKNYNE